jgi:hypothetical protein
MEEVAASSPGATLGVESAVGTQENNPKGKSNRSYIFEKSKNK